MTVQDLPLLNASLNGAATVLIIAALVATRAGKKKAHGSLMALALLVSAAFLTSYLVYHYHVGSAKFAGEGWVRWVYYSMLISHVLLAIVNLPMIIMTLVPVFQRRFDRHKRIARWTAPIWLYVSITGVLVYLMCYRWFGPPIF